MTSQAQLATKYQLYTFVAVSVVYDTFQKFFFLHACSYDLILYFNHEMKLSVLPLKVEVVFICS